MLGVVLCTKVVVLQRVLQRVESVTFLLLVVSTSKLSKVSTTRYLLGCLLLFGVVISSSSSFQRVVFFLFCWLMVLVLLRVSPFKVEC